ncbi:MAG: hypothetical protein EHM26_09955 [Desulfobacteraceae bacterium]|nr:MAG: hypothetical protein EHM26_09955 [Desulfobacteraceae bacterium]
MPEKISNFINSLTLSYHIYKRPKGEEGVEGRIPGKIGLLLFQHDLIEDDVEDSSLPIRECKENCVNLLE